MRRDGTAARQCAARARAGDEASGIACPKAMAAAGNASSAALFSIEQKVQVFTCVESRRNSDLEDQDGFEGKSSFRSVCGKLVFSKGDTFFI
jgi:hypothetical protein